MKQIPTPAGALSTFLAQPVARVYQWLILWLRRHTTIRFRIYLFAGVMLLMFYSVTLYLFAAYVADIKSERMTSLHFVVSDLLTSAAGQALRRGDKDHIVALVNTLVDTTEISRIAVLDSGGDVFVERTDAREASSDIETFSVPVIWRGVDVNATVFFDIDAISVKGRDITVGSVTCEIDNEALGELVWKAFLARGYIVLIPIILSFPVSYILAMSLVRPLGGIMKTLSDFEAADYASVEEAQTTKYKDEYAQLSRALVRAGGALLANTRTIQAASADLKKHSEELEKQFEIAVEARKAADEANARKDIFVANITHEFNGPLQGVLGGVDLVDQILYELLSTIDGIDPGRTFPHHTQRALRDDIFQALTGVEAAKCGSQEIAEMVTGLLASIQDVHEEITLYERPVHLRSSMSAAVRGHELFAKSKGLGFTFVCPEFEDVWILTDWTRVAQVFNALILNAIRFTDKGCVRVGARVLVTPENVNLFVEVSDTGSGISPAEREAIFDLLDAGEHPRRRFAPGLGTGLAIARKVTEKLGGTIALQSSTLQRGSCFTFECQFKRAEAGEVVDAARLSPGNDRAPAVPGHINLLYVEDSRINQIIFQEYCRRYGINLIVASDGREGFTKYLKGRFDALVIDCYLPLYDGFDLVSDIRAHEAAQGLERSLIFALTADETEKNRRRCSAAGFDELIAKPYTQESYTSILSRIAAARKVAG